MEENNNTWVCPKCHSSGNAGRFCTKCGTENTIEEKLNEKKENKKSKAGKVIETIVAIAMVVFFSFSLVLVLSPMMTMYDSAKGVNDSVDFYYFFYTVWANLKVDGNAINILYAIVSTIVFIAGLGAVYFFAITGLIDSIKVIKTHKDPKYTKSMMGVICAMFSYYSIISMLYTENINRDGYRVNNSNGSAIALFIMLLVMLLVALMARSLVFAIIDKKPFKIAATIIKFVSIIFIISAVEVSTHSGMTYANNSTLNYFKETLTFVNWSVVFFKTGSTSPGITALIGAATIALALAAGICALCLSYGSLMDDKHDKKASILTAVFCGLLFVAITMSTATFFLADISSTSVFVPYELPTAIILSLLGIIGITVASALEKEKKVN